MQIGLDNRLYDPNETIKKPSQKFKTMQQLYGSNINFKCKECKHFLRNDHRGKTYLKCKIWRVSNSSATDIKANGVACGKFDIQVENEVSK